jgi:type IV fimbrial biogenesis protein FimT
MCGPGLDGSSGAPCMGAKRAALRWLSHVRGVPPVRLRGAKKSLRGFTLLELVMTLTVAGILTVVAVPSFLNITRNSRAAANANELVTAFSIARSEAIRRGASVSICRTADGATCGGTWQNGWIVFADGAATDTAAPVVSEVLRVWPATTGEATVATTANNAAVDLVWVRFLPRGTVRSSFAMPLRYDVQIGGCTGTQARAIELNTIGRTTVTQAACT